jgi:hypothetical protein
LFSVLSNASRSTSSFTTGAGTGVLVDAVGGRVSTGVLVDAVGGRVSGDALTLGACAVADEDTAATRAREADGDAVGGRDGVTRDAAAAATAEATDVEPSRKPLHTHSGKTSDGDV